MVGFPALAALADYEAPRLRILLDLVNGLITGSSVVFTALGREHEVVAGRGELDLGVVERPPHLVDPEEGEGRTAEGVEVEVNGPPGCHSEQLTEHPG